MLLRSLDVENFRVLREVRLTFGRGLNVLFGPNDVGKSSLADALRAAFLLPFGSTEGRDFVPWGTDSVPRVVLVFETKGAAWRITKTFGPGSRGSALLEQVEQSGSLREEARHRAVDGKLREILAWGIPAPGGRAAPRGLPESYLTTALLARQDKVTAILEANLETDGADSGRNLVTSALGALGQDPLVARLLERLEERTEKVFTAEGNLRRAEDSPIVQLTNKVKERDQRVRDLDGKVSRSQEIEHRVQVLTEQRTNAAEECSRLQRRLELLRTVKNAEDELATLCSAKAAVEEAEAALAQIQEDLRQKESRRQDARSAVLKIDEELRLARERLAKAEGSLDEVRKNAQQVRQTRCAELVAKRDTTSRKAQSARECIQAQEQVQSRKTELARAEAEYKRAQQGVICAENNAELTSLLSEWRRANEVVDALKTAQAEWNEASISVNEAEVSLKKTESELSEAERTVTSQKDALDTARRAASQRDLRMEMLRASLVRAETAEREAVQTVVRAKAANAWSERLADAEQSLAQLEAAEHELEVKLSSNTAKRQACEARPLAPKPLLFRAALLGGLLGAVAGGALGIALQLEPAVVAIAVVTCGFLAAGLAAVIAKTRSVGEANQVWRRDVDDLVKAREPLLERRNQLSAQRGVAQLRVDSTRSERDRALAEVGEREFTLEALELRIRDVRLELGSIRAELATLQGLPQDGAVTRAQVEAAEGAVVLLKAQVSERKGLLDEARRQLAEAQVRVEATTHSAASVDLANLQERLTEARTKVDGQANPLPDAGAAQISVLHARQIASDRQTDARVSKERLTDAQAQLATLAATFHEPVEQVLAQAEKGVENLEKTVKELDQVLATELGAAAEEFADLQAEVTRLQEELIAGQTEAEAANLVHAEIRTKCEETRRQLAALRQSLPATNATATETALAQAREELELCPGSEDLTAAENLLPKCQAVLQRTDKDFSEARGQLKLVGGTVAREERDDELEKLEALRTSADELELEYKATRRLLDLLKKADEEHAAHLGRCLAEPVTERFLELTAGRYGQVVLDSGLRFQSIAAKGAERELASLSVGTRDQLATLVRLALAAHLKSVVLLDDQLTQTDPVRLLWFRNRLRASARDHDHQIIVITCRPLDYLHPDEMPGPACEKLGAEEGRLVVMNLEQLASCD